ncbi:hypothetical protein KCV01_g8825, partial [Aureobasidium melanogenum]
MRHVIAAMFSMMLGSAAPPLFAKGVPDIVTDVMNDTYGHDYDARNQCWLYRRKDIQGIERMDCMRPGKPDVVDGSLYLRTFNATDIGDARFAYAHVEPGVMGAFRVEMKGAGKWAYVAREPAMAFGSAGDCGCSHARFVKLGTHGPYGWMFSSGGTWSAVVVENLNIVTDVHGHMKDIAGLSIRAEATQDTTYRYSLSRETSGDRYPLHAQEIVKGKPTKAFDLPFDPATSRYTSPEGH